MAFNAFMKMADVKGESLGDQGDSFVFQTTEPAEPSGGESFSCSNNLRGGGFSDGHNDGGIIVDYTPGPDDNAGFLIINWLAEDHVDPSDPSAGLFPTETVRPMESLDDAGIIIIGGFSTETMLPMESLHI